MSIDDNHKHLLETLQPILLDLCKAAMERLGSVLADDSRQRRDDRRDKLHQNVMGSILARIKAIEVRANQRPHEKVWDEANLSSERARLHGFLSILPLLNTSALTYLRGLFQVDGRPGDYIAPCVIIRDGRGVPSDEQPDEPGHGGN